MYEAEVSQGAAWLDQVSPGWEQRINPNVLMMDYGCKCVLGQIFGSSTLVGSFDGYSAVLEALRLATGRPYNDDQAYEWMIEHGFLVKSEGEWPGDEWYKDEYSKLEQVWVDLIKERFSIGALSDRN